MIRIVIDQLGFLRRPFMSSRSVFPSLSHHIDTWHLGIQACAKNDISISIHSPGAPSISR